MLNLAMDLSTRFAAKGTVSADFIVAFRDHLISPSEFSAYFSKPLVVSEKYGFVTVCVTGVFSSSADDSCRRGGLGALPEPEGTANELSKLVIEARIGGSGLGTAATRDVSGTKLVSPTLLGFEIDHVVKLISEVERKRSGNEA